MAGYAQQRWTGLGLRQMDLRWGESNVPSIAVLFGCFARKIDGPGLPGGLIVYQQGLLIMTHEACQFIAAAFFPFVGRGHWAEDGTPTRQIQVGAR